MPPLDRATPDLSRSPFLESPHTDPRSLYRYRDGIYAADLLTAAVVWLDLFSWLDGRKSSKAEICSHFEICERPTDVLLTLLAALALVERQGDDVELTPLGREHLAHGSPWCIAPYYAPLGDRATCRDFVEILRSDRVASWMGMQGAKDWHRAMEDEAFARPFTKAMDSRGAYLGNGLARSLDLRRHGRLLDVGGGSGIYACALTRAHPQLRATVLDKPPVDAVAAKAIAERGCSDRVEVRGGDMFAAPWPDDADVHLLSNVLHDWNEADVRRLLARSFAALPPGGLLVIHDAFIDAEKRGPLAVAEYSALLLYLTQGKCWSVAEHAAFLNDAGFEAIEYQPTVADRGRMTARRPA